MASVYTVSQVNSYIKNMFSQDFALKSIYIKGEVSNLKYHTTGHVYFTLKDKGGVISAVMFKGNRRGLNFTMKEGMTVIALGEVGVYEVSGKYQLYAKEIIEDGAGILNQKFEELKTRLEEMGMFSAEYKKPIPKYAMNVGIVTAKTGAAVQDIINISKRRNPYVSLTLYPAYVQGEQAAASIVNGIHKLDSMDMDVIIIGRGGGSIEDLWAFNEEIVARAIFECETPIISAVGHETDFTIADFVSDLRAPTPSAAAELAVFDYNQMSEQLYNLKKRMWSAGNQMISNNRFKTEYYNSKLKYLSPSNRLMIKRQQADEFLNKIDMLMRRNKDRDRHRLELLSGRLAGLSPLNKISRGFGYISGEDNKPVIDAFELSNGDRINITLQNGVVKARVEDVKEVEYGR